MIRYTTARLDRYSDLRVGEVRRFLDGLPDDQRVYLSTYGIAVELPEYGPAAPPRPRRCGKCFGEGEYRDVDAPGIDLGDEVPIRACERCDESGTVTPDYYDPHHGEPARTHYYDG